MSHFTLLGIWFGHPPSRDTVILWGKSHISVSWNRVSNYLWERKFKKWMDEWPRGYVLSPVIAIVIASRTCAETWNLRQRLSKGENASR